MPTTLAGKFAAVSQGNADFAGVLDDVVVGEDIAVGRHDHARAKPVLRAVHFVVAAIGFVGAASLLAEEAADEIALIVGNLRVMVFGGDEDFDHAGATFCTMGAKLPAGVRARSTGACSTFNSGAAVESGFSGVFGLVTAKVVPPATDSSAEERGDKRPRAEGGLKLGFDRFDMPHVLTCGMTIPDFPEHYKSVRMPCQGRDSNPYSLRNQILSLARLPISPPWLLFYFTARV